jgi:hypothetical protein
MQLLPTKKKLAAITGTGLFAATLFAVPLGGSASASPAAPMATIGDNAAVNVQTEYSCSSHMLTADVKNKLDKDISPQVIFDQLAPDMPGMPPFGGYSPTIKPGESAKYMFYTSGDQRVIPVSVGVDGYDPVKVDPLADCNEPVSLKVTDFSSKGIVGWLTNNNSSYPQTVKLTVGAGPSQEVTLLKNQSVQVVLPFDGTPEQTAVSLTVTTGPDYESHYVVDLTVPIPVPPMPGPKPSIQ